MLFADIVVLFMGLEYRWLFYGQFQFFHLAIRADRTDVALNSEKRFWEIIGKLKELGAQGILVTPIEKMIL